MSRCFPPIKVVMDEASAIHRIKMPDGTYEDIPVNTLTFNTGKLGEFIETLEIQKGLMVNIVNVPANVGFEIEFNYETSPISIGCTMESTVSMTIEHNGSKETTIIPEKTLYIARQDAIRGKTTKKVGTPLTSISIMFDPKLAHVIFRDSMKYLKKDFQKLFGEKPVSVYIPDNASAVAQAICESIINCSYPQPKRDFYIRTKAMEFMGYIFTEYLFQETNNKKSVLQPEEVDKIRNVRTYIHSRIETPPTIKELAKISGINDCKLKAGFKEVFGTTIYGYIRSEKMSQAKIMLETGRYNVSEIAWDLGYTNVSHFIQAFKKCYNVTPGQILVEIKNDLACSKIKHL